MEEIADMVGLLIRLDDVEALTELIRWYRKERIEPYKCALEVIRYLKEG